MNHPIRLKTTTPPLLITLTLLCFGLLPRAQAVVPPPDGGYPGFNTAEGQNALFSLTTGSANTAVGWFSLRNNTDASANTALGAGALIQNTGTNNIAVGAAAGLFQRAGSNNIYIGDIGVEGESNVIAIGAAPPSGVAYTRAYIGGVYDAIVANRQVYVNSDGQLGTLASSRRYKKQIKPMDNASEALFALKPVTFRYKQEIDPSHKLSFGLVAEEVAQVSTDLISRDKKGKPQTVRYEAVNAMLLNEFLKEHRKIEEQQATITELKKAIARLAARDEEQAAQIQKVSAQLEASKPAPQMVNNP